MLVIPTQPPPLLSSSSSSPSLHSPPLSPLQSPLNRAHRVTISVVPPANTPVTSPSTYADSPSSLPSSLPPASPGSSPSPIPLERHNSVRARVSTMQGGGSFFVPSPIRKPVTPISTTSLTSLA